MHLRKDFAAFGTVSASAGRFVQHDGNTRYTMQWRTADN